MFFNLHTHLPANNTPGVTVICNLAEGFDAIPQQGCYSVGLHPWHLQLATLSSSFQQLQHAALQTSVWAIGECGLDKVCDTYWRLQQEAFALQIALANKIQKPLIIHCVRAFAEVQQMLQQQQVSVPVVFHGFNKSAVLAQQLVKQGYYLSFGKNLQHISLQEVIKAVPVSHVFLETDNAAISIEEVYALAASTLNTTVDLLCLRLAENVQQVFGKGLNPI